MKQSLTKQLTFLMSVLMILSSTAYAAKNKKSYEGSMGMIQYRVIKFDKGSSTLSDVDRATLRGMVRDTLAKQAMGPVTVSAWSDFALPKPDSTLSDADRTLAGDRAAAISEFLKTEMNVSDITEFNMAESSNWLARTLGTRDSELKSVFSKKNSKAPVTNAEFQVIKNEGGPSHAVVITEKHK